MTAAPNPSDETIRRATTADAEALAELGATTFVEAFGTLYAKADLDEFLRTAKTPDAFRRLVGDPAIGAFLTCMADRPVGYVIAGPCKLPVAGLETRAGEVQQLYLLAAYHGNGRGTRLLVTALEWLEQQHRGPLYVGVWSKNAGAQRLYGRFGFAKVGEYDFPVGDQLDREFILKRG